MVKKVVRGVCETHKVFLWKENEKVSSILEEQEAIFIKQIEANKSVIVSKMKELIIT